MTESQTTRRCISFDPGLKNSAMVVIDYQFPIKDFKKDVKLVFCGNFNLTDGRKPSEFFLGSKIKNDFLKELVFNVAYSDLIHEIRNYICERKFPLDIILEENENRYTKLISPVVYTCIPGLGRHDLYTVNPKYVWSKMKKHLIKYREPNKKGKVNRNEKKKLTKMFVDDFLFDKEKAIFKDLTADVYDCLLNFLYINI